MSHPKESLADRARSAAPHVRREYGLHGLLEEEAHENPFVQFGAWLEEARQVGVLEPTAMTLATVGQDGTPSARIVLLKGFDEEGFVFFTNYASTKGHEIAGNAKVALVFFWAELERQVRIQGTATRVSREESEAYFHSRPLGSQLGAWASRQSTVVKSREVLEARLSELAAEYEGKEIPLPPFWGGYRVAPATIELWQGRESRLHDRLRYTRDGASGWRRERLSP